MLDTELNRRNIPATADGETVISVKHWTDSLFSFRIERPSTFRFRSGEFAMIGLTGENGKPLLRAYSVASPSWGEELEFYSIKVQDGPLTSKLQHIQPGDKVILRPKATGTLVLDALVPGKRLYMFATGTGFAPFASLIRDPETYEKFDQIVLTHTCRKKEELVYGEKLVVDLRRDDLMQELLGEDGLNKLVHYTTLTRDDHPRKGRITDRIKSKVLFSDLGIPEINAETDRAMICGSMGLNNDLKEILNDYGMAEGANNKPAEYVLEKAFVG